MKLPEINIGLVGHVAHGKTILTKALTGKLTLKHSEELKRGITIKLGYADAAIFKCKDCNYYFTNSNYCPNCLSKNIENTRTISFLDAPGHETLMVTVLTASALMDGAILVIASNEKVPQPQTKEHLKALELAGIKNVVVAQTKIDLVRDKQKLLENYYQIKDFLKNTPYENSPIIPVSAAYNVNINYLIEAIEKYIPTPKRSENAKARFYAIRSFDINKPGTKIKDLKGAVLGGSVVQGKFKVGEEIEIKPGYFYKGKYYPLTAKIESIQKSGKIVEEADVGGLVGLMVNLDPAIAREDFLAGRIVGKLNELPEEVYEIELEVNLLERFVGTEEERKIEPIKPNETLLINVACQRTVGIVKNVKNSYVELQLKLPIIIEKDYRILLSRQFSGSWRLIGYGKSLQV
ncbi:MAG: translation initiation factor IF-2 subunit gamma [Candidatus Aenigmatarchaeota archaeon]